jgi:hypothetical protein
MIKSFRLMVLSLFLCTSFTVQAQSTAYQVQSFSQIEPIVKKQHLSARHTLWLFDIDNTLLVMNSDLGSPAWYNWQSSLVKRHQPSAIIPTMKQMFPFNDFVLDRVKMNMSEPYERLFLHHLRSQHAQMIALTARDPAVRKFTSIDLSSNRIKGLGFPGVSNQDINFNSRLYYSKGVLYTAGGNKSADLNLLLHRLHLQHRYNSFVFVDDTQHNIDVFSHYFSHASHIKAYGFHYRHNLKHDAAFAAENKTQIEKVDQAVLKRYHQQRDNLS